VIDYWELAGWVIPEIIVTLTLFAVLALDLLALRTRSISERNLAAAGVATVGCLLALGWLVLANVAPGGQAGMVVWNDLTRWVKGALLGLAILVFWLQRSQTFTPHVGELFALTLLSTLGLLFLAGAENLLMIFVALELASLSLYALVAFDKRNPRSAEAGLKYFLFGSVAAAFLLYGLSLIYGLAGSLDLRVVALNLGQHPVEPVLLTALVMVAMGFGFKVAAVPFHLWAPDAYQGAPSPVASLVASGSKVAGVFVLAKLLVLGFGPAAGNAACGRFAAGWLPLLAVMATGSLIWGNLGALAQTSVKRLLAYSAIGHAGYMLLGLLACGYPDGQGAGLESLLYYVVTYALATIGAFGVVSLLEGPDGDVSLTDFAGFARRDPLMALCLLVFLLSLAGIPPLAGFFGKFWIFAAAARAAGPGLGLLWLVFLGIAMSAVSLYYYLAVLKQAYVTPPAQPLATAPFPTATRVALAIAALVIVGLGMFPGTLLGPLGAALQQAGW
jgi:NADH-quinone oxidoreductase subunit N